MSGVSMTLHQFRYEQRIFWRNRSNMFFAFLFPLLLTVLFVGIFGHGTDGHANKLTLIPGIGALSIVSTCFQGLAISIVFHREQGVLKRIVATPLRLGSLVLSKMLSVAIVALIEVVLIVVVGSLVYGLGWPHAWGVLVASVVMGLLSCSALGMALAALIPNGDAAPAVANAAYLPMMFISGVFYPMSELPRWLRDIGEALPLYHLAAPIRNAYAGRPADLWVHVVVLAAWGVAGAVFAIARFKWEPSR